MSDRQNMFQCPLCLEVFNGNVVECPECYEIFCQQCVTKAYKAQKTCPLCRKTTPDIINWHRNLAIERRVGNLSCECENKAAGCPVVVTRFTKSEHEMSCEFGQVKCKLGCNQTLRRKDFADHQALHCAFRPVECPQTCGQLVKFNETEIHIAEECPNTDLDCPNECGTQLARGKIADHRKECPLELLDCLFATEGCDARVLRKDYEEHATTPKHILYAATAIHARDARIQQLETDQKALQVALSTATHTLTCMQETIALLCTKSGVVPPPPPAPPAPSAPAAPTEPGPNAAPALPEVDVGDCVRIEDAGHLYPTVGRIPDHSGLESWPSEDVKKMSINVNWKRRHVVGDVGVVIHCTRHALAKIDVLIVKVENDYVCVNKMGVKLLSSQRSRVEESK